MRRSEWEINTEMSDIGREGRAEEGVGCNEGKLVRVRVRAKKGDRRVL